jgi:hypothetical protein
MRKFLKRFATAEHIDSMYQWAAIAFVPGSGAVTGLLAFLDGRPLFEMVFYGLGAAAFASALFQIRRIRREHADIRGKVFIQKIDRAATRLNANGEREARYQLTLGNLSLHTVTYEMKRLEFVIEQKLHTIQDRTRFAGLIPPQGWTTIMSEYIPTPATYNENDECRAICVFRAEIPAQHVRLEQEISIERFAADQPIGISVKKFEFERLTDDNQ